MERGNSGQSSRMLYASPSGHGVHPFVAAAHASPPQQRTGLLLNIKGEINIQMRSHIVDTKEQKSNNKGK